MNKEVKELIEEIKVFNIEHSHHPYYLYTLDKKDVELLLDYINQLETNIDEAIEYIKYCQTSDKDIFPIIEAEKMIEILKGGSNE